MIYIYNPPGTESARMLVKALKELEVDSLLVSAGAESGSIPRYPCSPRSLVVCWGWSFHGGEWDRARVLNRRIVGNKKEELRRMALLGVDCPNASDFLDAGHPLARKLHHQEANDLTRLPPGQSAEGDYYVEYAPTATEFRIHVFQGRSLRVGQKVQREGVCVHPWIRTWDCGWGTQYDKRAQEQVTEAVRQAARDAVAALRYDFGAVDVGVRADGSPVVFEVNSAPGLETYTTARCYARRIAKLVGAPVPSRATFLARPYPEAGVPSPAVETP